MNAESLDNLSSFDFDVICQIKKLSVETMKTCLVCNRKFHVGKKQCCSSDCYFQDLQNRLDECFRKDTSHTKLLTH